MSDGTAYKQGDIVLLPFPYSDLTGSKQRPALIISNKKLDTLEDCICCLITTKPREGDVLIQNKHCIEGKLSLQSWIRPFRIFTINKGIIKRKLCTITDNFYNETLAAIYSYLQRG